VLSFDRWAARSARPSGPPAGSRVAPLIPVPQPPPPRGVLPPPPRVPLKKKTSSRCGSAHRPTGPASSMFVFTMNGVRYRFPAEALSAHRSRHQAQPGSPPRSVPHRRHRHADRNESQMQNCPRIGSWQADRAQDCTDIVLGNGSDFLDHSWRWVVVEQGDAVRRRRIVVDDHESLRDTLRSSGLGTKSAHYRRRRSGRDASPSISQLPGDIDRLTEAVTITRAPG